MENSFASEAPKPLLTPEKKASELKLSAEGFGLDPETATQDQVAAAREASELKLSAEGFGLDPETATQDQVAAAREASEQKLKDQRQDKLPK